MTAVPLRIAFPELGTKLLPQLSFRFVKKKKNAPNRGTMTYGALPLNNADRCASRSVATRDVEELGGTDVMLFPLVQVSAS